MREKEILPTVRNVRVELDELNTHGITGELSVKAGGIIRCESCSTEQRADEFEILDVRRLEGQSDPADMSAVVVARCGSCHQRGSIVLTFGPNASEADAEVLGLLDEHTWKKHSSPESKHDAH